MAKHIRPTNPPPTRIHVATAKASAVPLTGGLPAASAGAAESVTPHKADFTGEGDGDLAFSAGSSTASGQRNAGDFNHDGFDDLAIVAEHENVGTDLEGGTVAVLQGSAWGACPVDHHRRLRGLLSRPPGRGPHRERHQRRRLPDVRGARRQLIRSHE
ncbi:FG-GAP repeat protein [Streptomyces sp. HUAS MG91]|uniref:FG-GAP repeat protein n=1 Tax=Streptomyces tabacisoli TaxID=3156398 RepID=A0AAU8J3B4_9ACTN